MKTLSTAEVLLNRFWSKVDIKGPGECWLWKACKRDRRGYGGFKLNSKLQMAHRVSWKFHNGPIPKGKLVLHKCDNPRCVNPNHLYIGTQSDNQYDRSMRSSKLSLEECQEIKELYLTEEFTQSHLARMFGCNQQDVSNAVIKTRLP